MSGDNTCDDDSRKLCYCEFSPRYMLLRYIVFDGTRKMMHAMVEFEQNTQ